jgi:DNA-binding protein H-NS
MKDVNKMSAPQLQQLRDEVDDELRRRQRLIEAALKPNVSRRAGYRIAPKYRNPDDHSQTWAGRGLRPRWLADALKKRGTKLDQFAIH